jgi:hypothetical protein
MRAGSERGASLLMQALATVDAEIDLSPDVEPRVLAAGVSMVGS